MATKQLSLDVAADYLGLKERQLRNLMNEGLPYSGSGTKVRIPWPEARHWRDKKLIEQGKAQASQRPGGDAISRKAAADAEMAEIKVQRERGDLITKAEAVKEVREEYGQLRAQLLTLPQRWAPRVVGLKGLVEATNVLTDAVHEAMTALSADRA